MFNVHAKTSSPENLRPGEVGGANRNISCVFFQILTRSPAGLLRELTFTVWGAKTTFLYAFTTVHTVTHITTLVQSGGY